jgi:hypothetical protein
MVSGAPQRLDGRRSALQRRRQPKLDSDGEVFKPRSRHQQLIF